MQVKSILFLCLMAMSIPIVQAQNPSMKKIFNGKNLKGWVAHENKACWTVKDGVLSVKNEPEQKGSILWTKKKYKDFAVQLDFKFGEGTIDSGIFMRAESPQIQIGISGSLKRDMTGSPYVPGKGYPVEARGIKDLLKMDDWNTLRAQAVGNTYTVWLNGQEVMTYTMEENTTLEGPIGLQLHPGREMSIDFRNIKVARL